MKTARFAAIVVAAASALSACGREPSRERTHRPVRVQAVQREAAGGGTRYSATIQPYAQVSLAFKVGGYVRAILQRPGVGGRLRDVQQGDAVARGTVLARLDASDYQERANQARAQLAEAEAGLARAGADAERAEGLYQAHSLTRPDYDAARASRAASQARVDAARAQLAAAEIALRDCSLVAPADMVVLSRNVERGTLAGAGTVGFVLADLAQVKAVFGVPDRLVERVRVGTPLALTTDAFGDLSFSGRISAVSPSADPLSRVFGIEVTIENPRRQLKAGMIATVAVPSAAGPEIPAGVAWVPVSAIVKSGRPNGGYAVFLADGEGEHATARGRDVSLGAISGNRVAVTSGLAPGQRVIVTGASLLTDGDPVRVIPGEGP